jgi:O-antigen/teichoic acid export membrane protein
MRLLIRMGQTALLWNFVSTVLRSAGLILVLPVLLRTMPSSELGLWYVFLSISGAASLLDFGFNSTVVQSVGYVWAGARQLKQFGLHTDEIESKPNLLLLGHLLGTMRFYYRLLSAIILLLLLTLGSWWIWHKTLGMDQAHSFLLAWVVFSFGTAYNVYGSVWPAFLSGINGVRQAQQLFAASLIVNYVVLLSALLAGWGIWSMVAGQLIMGIVQRYGGKIVFFRLAGSEFVPQETEFGLLKTLWPMASRFGVIGLAGFLLNSGVMIACSAELGLRATASYGLSMQAIIALSGLSLAWITVKMPYLNQLRVQNQLPRLVHTFINRTRAVVLTYLVGGLTLLLLGEMFLRWIDAKTQLLPFPQFAALMFIYLIDSNRICYELIVLSENQNPFILSVLLSSIGVLMISIILMPFLGIWGIVIAYIIAQFSFNYWWTVLRGIRGLRITSAQYFGRFFGLKEGFASEN